MALLLKLISARIYNERVFKNRFRDVIIMNEKKIEKEKKQTNVTVDKDETVKLKVDSKSDVMSKEEQDCRDNCMHCGYHCKYLKD
jgi:hypothetical protein